MIPALAGKHRHRRMISDAGAEPIPRLKKLSRAFGVPITVITTARHPPHGQ